MEGCTRLWKTNEHLSISMFFTNSLWEHDIHDDKYAKSKGMNSHWLEIDLYCLEDSIIIVRLRLHFAPNAQTWAIFTCHFPLRGSQSFVQVSLLSRKPLFFSGNIIHLSYVFLTKKKKIAQKFQIPLDYWIAKFG